MEVLYAVLLVLACITVWSLNLIGLPGNWLILAIAAPWAYFMRPEARIDIGWAVIGGLVVLAILGELVEFLAGALGAKSAGGSRRGAALAMVGSLMGGVVGLFTGAAIPIPIVGSVIGALLFAGLGALAGAVLGEQWKGRDLDASIRVGHAAFWGRLVGTLGKIVFGVGMIVLLAMALAV